MSKYTAGRDLAEDLAKSRDQEKWMTWTEIPLGSVMWSNGHTPRADVLAISKSYNPSFIIYEVKISRSDFLADVNAGKYESYFNYSNQVYFAAETGLIKAADVPDTCGLFLRGDGGWRVSKAAPRRQFKMETEFLLKLLIAGYTNRLEEWKQYDKLKLLKYKGLKDASLKYGKRFASDIEDSAGYIEKAAELRKEIEKVTGKSYDTISYALMSLQGDVKQLLTQYKFMDELKVLVDSAMALFNGEDYMTKYLPERIFKVAKALELKVKTEKESDG